MEVAQGYPEDSPTNPGVIRSLLFARPKANNELCSKGAITSARKKRNVDDFLPQSVLNDAVNDAKSEIVKAAKDCCGATLEQVETPDPNEGLGSKASKSMHLNLLIFTFSLILSIRYIFQ